LNISYIKTYKLYDVIMKLKEVLEIFNTPRETLSKIDFRIKG
jgi:hypothetical protein